MPVSLESVENTTTEGRISRRECCVSCRWSGESEESL